MQIFRDGSWGRPQTLCWERWEAEQPGKKAEEAETLKVGKWGSSGAAGLRDSGGDMLETSKDTVTISLLFPADILEHNLEECLVIKHPKTLLCLSWTLFWGQIPLGALLCVTSPPDTVSSVVPVPESPGRDTLRLERAGVTQQAEELLWLRLTPQKRSLYEQFVS